MAVCNSGFELGANSATVATTDRGDGDAWDTVSLGTGTTCAYDTTHAALGALGCKIANDTGSKAAVTVRWGAKLGTLTDQYGRIYLYFTALPSASITLARATSGASTCCSINVLLTTGLLTLTDQSGTARATSANAIAVNQWIRLDYHFVHSTTVGQMEAKLFNTATSAIPTETITSLAVFNTLASADGVRYGVCTSTTAAVGPFWIDQVQGGATGYPGPAPVGLPRGALAGVGQ